MRNRSLNDLHPRSIPGAISGQRLHGVFYHMIELRKSCRVKSSVLLGLGTFDSRQKPRERQLYIGCLAGNAQRIGQAIRYTGRLKTVLHWCMAVIIQDDQMQARVGRAAHNLVTFRHITLSRIRLDPVKRKGGIKVRRLIASTSDQYRVELLGPA